jgi:hypothetical protein
LGVFFKKVHHMKKTALSMLAFASISLLSGAAMAGGHVSSMGGNAMSSVSVKTNGATIGSLGINSNAGGGAANASAPAAYNGKVKAMGGDAGSMVGLKAKNGGVLNPSNINSNAWGGVGTAYSN